MFVLFFRETCSRSGPACVCMCVCVCVFVGRDGRSNSNGLLIRFVRLVSSTSVVVLVVLQRILHKTLNDFSLSLSLRPPFLPCETDPKFKDRRRLPTTKQTTHDRHTPPKPPAVRSHTRRTESEQSSSSSCVPLEERTHKHRHKQDTHTQGDRARDEDGLGFVGWVTLH